MRVGDIVPQAFSLHRMQHYLMTQARKLMDVSYTK